MTGLTVDLIAYPCGCGARDDRCAHGPAELEKAGLDIVLARAGCAAQWLDMPIAPDPKQAHTREKVVIHYGQALYTQVKESIQMGHVAFVFGGDHSMAAGTWSGVVDALNAREHFGLLWIDAHMDAHTEASTHSGNLHGMPLASLLGRGKMALNTIGGPGAKLKPEHVCMIGIRSYEPEEEERLGRLGVTVYDMKHIRARGLKAVWDEALQKVKKGTNGIGITIDLDAFDPQVAPGTGMHERDGLLKDEVLAVLQGMIRHSELKAVEIAEYNPAMDVNGQTKQLICDLLRAIVTQ